MEQVKGFTIVPARHAKEKQLSESGFYLSLHGKSSMQREYTWHLHRLVTLVPASCPCKTGVAACREREPIVHTENHCT
jgi:hypothetical protein